MAIVVGSNIASLGALRQLTKSSAQLSAIYSRLSSGLRITKAADDAAGLAVASGLDADARVFHQGVRNLNDGISYLNIAEGATSEFKNILFRLDEIAEQSANGVYSNNQRQALEQEVQGLQSEYNRIIDTTSFNGNNVFTSPDSELVLQAGYGTSGQLSIDLTTTPAAQLTGDGTFQAAGTYNASQVDLLTVSAGDVNGDGYADLVFGNYFNATRILLSLGNGNGASSASRASPSPLRLRQRAR